jgi:hypothetical protein
VTQVTTVPNTAYYRRAIARGDVALAEPVSTVADDETA